MTQILIASTARLRLTVLPVFGCRGSFNPLKFRELN
jgi:hypothetical protein